MMKIALFPKTHTEHTKKLALEVLNFLTGKGVMVVMDEEHAQEFQTPSISNVNMDEVQFFISMGGDGTILRLLHTYKNFDVPIIGINTGHLGFMADIPAEDIYPSLTDLLSNAYQIEKRIVLNGEHEENSGFAINDIVIHRSQNPHLVELAIKVDGGHMNTFEADGLIVATPTGSTAYSLAAGGPILTPSLGAIVLTPICPHTISNRPIVLSADSEIEIQYLSPYDPVEVVFDGISHGMMQTGKSLKITRNDKDFKMVALKRHDYFSTLRSKLGWVGKLR